MRDAGRSDLSDLNAGPGLVFLMATAGSTLVGSRLSWNRPRNPAGWLFLLLALSIVLSGMADTYGAYGAVYDPGSVPAARLVAVYSDGTFLPWVSLLGLILLVTPSGSAPSARWKPVGWAAVASCVVFLSVIPFRSTPLDASPFQGITSPYADNPFAGIFRELAFGAVVVGHLALLAAVASLVTRAYNAGPEERRQLRWLLIPAVPFPFLVVGAWIAAVGHHDLILGVLGAGYLFTVPIAAGLAIEKRGLYDVDRILSRTVAYTLLSAVIVVSYLAIVLSAGILGGRATAESVPAAVMATTVALVTGGLARRRLQELVDRRFNRRTYAALSLVRLYVREPDGRRTIEDALREASGDTGLRVAYWVESATSWVSESGESALVPDNTALLVPAREGGNGAAITFDVSKYERELVASLAAAARPELENARLRAAIQLQLVEVRESRARIVSAQAEERGRLERDLHDGSQQRLLALALNLRATELSGDAEAALRALPDAVSELQTTVRELRRLANGLHPSALEDGGLAAALQELAARAPIP
ncbi:MAG: histidine kinase, partial [Tepidiformaceae bacterium]